MRPRKPDGRNVHEFKFDYYTEPDAIPFSFDYGIISVKGRAPPAWTVEQVLGNVLGGLGAVTEAERRNCPECDGPLTAGDHAKVRHVDGRWMVFHAKCVEGIG